VSKRNRGCIVHVHSLEHPWQLKIELDSCAFKLPVHHHLLQEAYWRRIGASRTLEARDFISAHQEVGFSTSLIFQFIMLVVKIFEW
jgi:hypothetical protein